jgi:hypothetical protein
MPSRARLQGRVRARNFRGGLNSEYPCYPRNPWSHSENFFTTDFTDATDWELPEPECRTRRSRRQRRRFSFVHHEFYNITVPGGRALPDAVPHLGRSATKI